MTIKIKFINNYPKRNNLIFLINEQPHPDAISKNQPFLFLTLKKIIKIFYFIFLSVFMNIGIVLMDAIKRTSDSLEQELYMVVGLHLVLGIKPTFSGTITGFLN